MDASSHVQILTEPVTSAACPKCGALLEIPEIPAFTMVQCPTCEFEFAAPARFGSFLLLQVLGMGGMGGVYRGRDEALNREVAIKVMQKSLGDDPVFVETFQREAQAAAKLNHSNIAQIYSFGQVMGQPYIAMELIHGGSFDKMMAAQGPLNPAVVFHVGAQIAEGLSEAAAAGLVHGDVKPENILFDTEKNAKLVDFGLAAMQSGGPDNEVWGTPYYIAPEKVRKQKTDLRSDIYSLGATLYHAIAGMPPFDGADAAAVVKARFDSDPKPLRSIRGNAVSEDAENIIKRMLSMDPMMRYPTYESLLGDIRRYLSKAGPVNVASTSKKIMIKGKRPQAVVAADRPPVPEGMVPVDLLAMEVESEQAAKRRGGKIIGMVFLGVFLLAVVAVGGVLGLQYSMEKNRQQEEVAKSEKTRKDAYARIALTVTEAKKQAERIRGTVPEAMKYATDAANAVVAALGEEARAWVTPPEPAALPLDTPPAPGGGTFSMDAAEVERLAKLLPPDLAKTLRELDKLPPDQALAKMEDIVKALPPKEAEELKPDLEMMKAMSEGLGGMMQQVAESMAAAMGEAMQQMAEGFSAAMGGAMQQADASADGVPDYAVIKIVRQMFTDAYAVKQAVVLADAYIEQMEAMAKAAQALNPDDPKKLIDQTNKIVEKGNEMVNLKALREAAGIVNGLKKTLNTVKAEVVSVAKTREMAAAEQAKQDKLAADLEKQQQAREALAAKIEEEVEQVREAEKAIVPMLKKMQTREASRTLRGLADSLTTKGGLEAQTTALERVNRIEEFQKYLVEKASGFKSSRGWSITAADAKAITVGGKSVTWAEIFESRVEIVAELVNGLAMNEQVTKAMRLRERTRLETNAALCLAMLYGDIPAAIDRAKQIATQAADNFEADADTIKKLMPEFFSD